MLSDDLILALAGLGFTVIMFAFGLALQALVWMGFEKIKVAPFAFAPGVVLMAVSAAWIAVAIRAPQKLEIALEDSLIIGIFIPIFVFIALLIWIAVGKIKKEHKEPSR